MANQETIKINLKNGYMFERGGKYFKLKKATQKRNIFVEVDLEEYKQLIHNLAVHICQSPGVSAVDILEDALNDYDLDRINEIKAKLEEEEERAKKAEEAPRIATKKGACTEICIGDKFSLVVRE